MKIDSIFLIIFIKLFHAFTMTHIVNLVLISAAFAARNVSCQDVNRGTNTNLAEALQFLREYDREASAMCYRVTLAQWRFVTNITEATRRRMAEELNLGSKFERVSWSRAAAFARDRLADRGARRQLEKLVAGSRAPLGDAKFGEVQHLISEMKEVYNAAKICPYGQRLPFDPQSDPPNPGTDSAAPYHGSDGYQATNSRSGIQNGQDHVFSTNSHQMYTRYGNPVSSHTTTEDSPYPNYCDMQLDPEISRILAHSRIESELLYVWRAFRDKTGPPLKNKFMRYVQLANEAAALSGFSDAGEQMRSAYEDSAFSESIQEMFTAVQPLYKQLFTYVRRKLVQRYGEGSVRMDGPIPAHLLGNMWAQNWKSIIDLVIPFPQTPNVDVTSEMLRQGYTPLRMFQLAEQFYTSMGMKSLPPEFWRGSMLTKPQDRSVQCTASAWDFCNRIDYRIKQCTEVTMQDLISTHHEMAHIQYYLQYADQTQLFRDGANPAFHEAVANAMGLSVYNIPHLQRIGLYHNKTNDHYEVSINHLLTLALEKVAYLPFAFMVDQWRWSVFQDGVQNMNTKWWEMKLRYQGIIPPVARSESDFDPGSKYHIISDQEYIKYFLATILEFQIYDQLCQVSGHSGHLHECDLYRSREAGRVLGELMKLGASKPASELIRTVLSRGKTNRISPESIVKYFRPLELWLRVQNRDEQIIGWNSNYEDVTLFSPLRNHAYSRSHSTSFEALTSILFLVVYVLF